MRTLNRIAMTLGEAIKQEMTRLKIDSNREFASKIGVSPGVINDILNGVERKLDIDTLVKISDYTGVALMTLIKLAFPQALHVDLDIEVLRDAEKIAKLPPGKQAIARGYISDAYVKGDDE